MSTQNPLLFIADLLSKADLSSSDRERIKSLAAKSYNIINSHIEPVGEKKEGNLIKHSPQELVSFLYQSFSRDDSLKWFAHTPDIQEFDYIQQMESAKRLQSIRKSFKNLNPRSWMLVYNYVLSNTYFWFNSDGKKVSHNWQSPELSNWCSNNPCRHPAEKEGGLVFQDGTSFEGVQKAFKHSIRFRTDDNELTFYKRVKAIVKEKLSQDFDIDYSLSLRSCDVDIYVDVGRIFSALGQILSWVADNKAKGEKVSIDYIEDSSTISLIILHHNSYLSTSDAKLEGLSGDWAEVRSRLFSVADWTIQADRGDGQSVCINCLDESINAKVIGVKAVVLTPNKISEPNDSKIGGVKHIITMHKNV